MIQELYLLSHTRHISKIRVVDKILVLGENGVTEYLGNYDYYIEKKRQLSEMNNRKILRLKQKLRSSRKKEKKKNRGKIEKWTEEVNQKIRR